MFHKNLKKILKNKTTRYILDTVIENTWGMTFGRKRRRKNYE